MSREEKTPLQIMRFLKTHLWFVRIIPIFKNTLFSLLSTNEKCASLCAKVIHFSSCQQLVLLISLFSRETRSASWLSFPQTEISFRRGVGDTFSVSLLKTMTLSPKIFKLFSVLASAVLHFDASSLRGGTMWCGVHVKAPSACIHKQMHRLCK